MVNENNFFFTLDKIDDKFIEEAANTAAAESVQPKFVNAPTKKSRAPVFAIAWIAACFVLIFGIGIAVSRSSGADITRSPLNTAEATEETACTTITEASEETDGAAAEQSEITVALTNNYGSIYATPIVITDSSGEEHLVNKPPLEKDELIDFKYEKFVETVRNSNVNREEEDYWDNGYDYIQSLNDAELTELFIRAKALAEICCNTERFDGLELEIYNGNYVYVPSKNRSGDYDSFCETGISYDSFYKACRLVFTEEAVNKMLYETYPFTYSYNDGLWVSYVSSGGGIWHSEVEPITATDTEVEFNLICYAPEGGWQNAYCQDPDGTWHNTEFDPKKRDIYKKAVIRNRFVKTEDGWRAEELEVLGKSSLNGRENFPEGYDKMEDDVIIHPYKWSEDGFTVPDSWIPVMHGSEPYESFDSLMNQTQEGKAIGEIIQNLVNGNIIAADIFYGCEPAFTLDYKVEEEGFGKINPYTGETNVYAIRSDYFNSLDEIESIMNKVYTADLAFERLYGEDRQLFLERDNRLYADLNCMYAWSVTSFIDDSYIEIISSDEKECFFNYHFILWDYFDYDNNDTAKLYPHKNEITVKAVKENGEWRLCSPVFNNLNLDYYGRYSEQHNS
ncbi:MAG: hypothetical protein NC203_07445 [Firmicutes bacterium]|nr:hypothetical protein [[Eubacterium] siraeum]MCM1488183.1 hypothetical protein [Bacillota bacterium]